MYPTIPLLSQGNVIYDTTSDFFFNFENVKMKKFVSLQAYQQMWYAGLFNSVYVQ